MYRAALYTGISILGVNSEVLGQQEYQVGPCVGIDAGNQLMMLHQRTRIIIIRSHNVFFLFVPPNTTSILQPLDVAVNKSYQALYQQAYDQYIGLDLENPECKPNKAIQKLRRMWT
jgi:DDE superfamily endonuclease